MKLIFYSSLLLFFFNSNSYAYLGLGPLIPVLASSFLWLFGIIISILAIFFTFFKGFITKKNKKTTDNKIILNKKNKDS